MKKMILAVVAALLVSPLGVFAQETKKQEKALQIIGSTTVGPIADAFGEAFKGSGKLFDQQLALEEELQGIAGNTHDYREGVRAFLEKRKPEFRGK